MPQGRDEQQRVVAAASDDPVGRFPRYGERRTVAPLVGRQHRRHPAVVDLGQPVAGELDPAAAVVDQQVADHLADPGDVVRQRVEQAGMYAGVAVTRSEPRSPSGFPLREWAERCRRPAGRAVAGGSRADRPRAADRPSGSPAARTQSKTRSYASMIRGIRALVHRDRAVRLPMRPARPGSRSARTDPPAPRTARTPRPSPRPPASPRRGRSPTTHRAASRPRVEVRADLVGRGHDHADQRLLVRVGPDRRDLGLRYVASQHRSRRQPRSIRTADSRSRRYCSVARRAAVVASSAAHHRSSRISASSSDPGEYLGDRGQRHVQLPQHADPAGPLQLLLVVQAVAVGRDPPGPAATTRTRRTTATPCAKARYAARTH